MDDDDGADVDATATDSDDDDDDDEKNVTMRPTPRRMPLKMASMKNGVPGLSRSKRNPPSLVRSRMAAPPTSEYTPAIEPLRWYSCERLAGERARPRR